MATYSLPDVLQSKTIYKAVSQLAAYNSPLLRFFGMNPGYLPEEGEMLDNESRSAVPGTATSIAQTLPNNRVSWDYFNHAREVAPARAPGSRFYRQRPQPVGNVTCGMIRRAFSIPLDYSKLSQQRAPGGQVGMVDEYGKRYTALQIRNMAEQLRIGREQLIGGMMRGVFYVVTDAENHYVTYTTPSSVPYFTVDYQQPSQMRSTLDISGGTLGGGVIIGAVWSNAATDIPGQLLKVKAAMNVLSGVEFKHVICNSTVWGYVLNNTNVKALAGTANRPFESWERESGNGPDGKPLFQMKAVLSGLPWLTWHVYDNVFQVRATDGTISSQALLPSDSAAFLPDPTPELFEFLEGQEVVVENFGDAGVYRQGMYCFTSTDRDPAGINLNAIDNGVPAAYVPRGWCYATVA